MSLLPKGSLLMVMRSGILAHSFPVSKTKRELTINQDLKALIPNKVVTSDFLFYFLRSIEQKVVSQYVKRGATVHSVIADILDLITQTSQDAAADALKCNSLFESIHNRLIADQNAFLKTGSAINSTG